ncbi:MAG: hypothetical protein ACE15F_24385 [bacterium]
MNAVLDEVQGKAVCGYYDECRAAHPDLAPSCGIRTKCPAIRGNRPALDGYHPARLAAILFSFFSNLSEEERHRILGEYWLRGNTPPASR